MIDSWMSEVVQTIQEMLALWVQGFLIQPKGGTSDEKIRSTCTVCCESSGYWL